MKSYLWRTWAFWKFVLLRFIEDDATYRAAGLTYATLLAFVPLLVVLFKILSFLPMYNILSKKVQLFIFNNFVVSKGSVIHYYVNSFTDQAHRLSFVGSIFLIIMVIMVLVTLEKVFNKIWRVKLELHTFKSIVSYWAGVFFAPGILLLAVIITSLLLSLPLLEFKIPGISISLLSMLPFALTVSGFMMLYYSIPNCRVKLRHALLAGIFSTVLFVLSKTAFAWYLKSFSVYKLLYGTFAIIPTFLIWIYLVWLITLLGAEVCYALGYRNSAKK